MAGFMVLRFACASMAVAGPGVPAPLWVSPTSGGDTPPGRYGHTAVMDLDGKMWMFGGASVGNTDGYSNDVYCLDTQVVPVSWSSPSTAGERPMGRFGHSAVMAADGKMWIFGGRRSRSDSSYLDDLYYLDTQARPPTWVSPVTSAGPAGRFGHSAVMALDGKMWIFGGRSGDSYLDDVYHLDTQATPPTWTRQMVTNPLERAYHTAVMDSNGKMWVFGGGNSTSSSLDDVQYFDAQEVPVTWTSPELDESPTGRVMHTAVMHNQTMWIVGGFAGSLLDDVYTLDLATPSWAPSSTSGDRMSGRYGHSAVMADGTIWVFGGLRHGSYDLSPLVECTKMVKAVVTSTTTTTMTSLTSSTFFSWTSTGTSTTSWTTGENATARLLELRQQQDAIAWGIFAWLQRNVTAEGGILHTESTKGPDGEVIATYAVQVPSDNSHGVVVDIEETKITVPASLIHKLQESYGFAIVSLTSFPATSIVMDLVKPFGDAEPQSDLVSFVAYSDGTFFDQSFDAPVQIEFLSSRRLQEQRCGKTQQVCVGMDPMGAGRRSSQPIAPGVCAAQEAMLVGLFLDVLEDSRPDSALLVAWWTDLQWAANLEAMCIWASFLLMSILLCWSIRTDHAHSRALKDLKSRGGRVGPAPLQTATKMERFIGDVMQRVVENELGVGTGFLDEMDQWEGNAVWQTRRDEMQDKVTSLNCAKRFCALYLTCVQCRSMLTPSSPRTSVQRWGLLCCAIYGSMAMAVLLRNPEGATQWELITFASIFFAHLPVYAQLVIQKYARRRRSHVFWFFTIAINLLSFHAICGFLSEDHCLRMDFDRWLSLQLLLHLLGIQIALPAVYATLILIWGPDYTRRIYPLPTLRTSATSNTSTQLTQLTVKTAPPALGHVSPVSSPSHFRASTSSLSPQHAHRAPSFILAPEVPPSPQHSRLEASVTLGRQASNVSSPHSKHVASVTLGRQASNVSYRRARSHTSSSFSRGGSKASVVKPRCAMFSARFLGGEHEMRMRQVHQILLEKGYDVMMVEAHLGDDFGRVTAECLGKLLKKKGALLAVCTANYAEKTDSSYSSFIELKFAHTYKLPIWPLRVEETYPPEPAHGPDHPFDQDGEALGLVKMAFDPSKVYYDCRMKSIEEIAEMISNGLDLP